VRNTDDTQRIIGARQLALLRDLAARTTDARTIDDACLLAAQSLATNARDLPFAAIYLLDSDHSRVALAAALALNRTTPQRHPKSSCRLPPCGRLPKSYILTLLLW